MIDSNNPVIDFDPLARCDRCGARAYALSYKQNYELYWCRHHAIKFMRELDADDWKFVWDTEGMQQLIDTGDPVPV